MNPKIYVLHYRPNTDRKRYLDEMFRASKLRATFIRDFDREAIDVDSIYRFDESLFFGMIEPIWHVLVGYVIGLGLTDNIPWSTSVAKITHSGTTLAQALNTNPWLRPKQLSAADVSIFLKHREAWKRLAGSDHPHATIAEDDIIFREQSGAYLLDLLRKLPHDTDFADLAGGCNLVPRIHNERVNDVFFRIDPPRDRTCCAYVISRDFARRLVALKLPICLPIDWTLTYAFNKLGAHVYWVEPTLFGHGSMMGVFPSHAKAMEARHV